MSSYSYLWWWIRQFFLTALALFFLFFGVSLLVSAYGLDNPYTFVMTFFGASLMTLISAVLVLGFVLPMISKTSRTFIVGQSSPPPATDHPDDAPPTTDKDSDG